MMDRIRRAARALVAVWERAFLAVALTLLSLLEFMPEWAWAIWGQMPDDMKALIPAWIAPKIPVALFALAMLSRAIRVLRTPKPPQP